MPTDHQAPVPAEDRAHLGQTAYKRELAYQHLGINPQDVERVPFLWPNLRGIARRLNRDRAEDAPVVCPLDLLQWSEDPVARKVLQKYLSRYVHPSHDSVLAAVERLGGHKIGHSDGQQLLSPSLNN